LLASSALSSSCPELEFGRIVSQLDLEGLVALLEEAHPVYEGRSENAVVRMRGWVLSRLAAMKPDDARLLPFVREELEAGDHPYPVAAASLVLRSMPIASADWLPLVDSALVRMRAGDDAVQFDRYPLDPLARARSSAVAELESTRGRLAGASTASASRMQLTSLGEFRRKVPIGEIEFEDHEGRVVSFDEFFVGRPSFAILFYTRCNNPNKCSANVARLAEVAQRLAAAGLDHAVNLAAITYDPAYDVPARLRSYALERGVPLGDRVRFLRVPKEFVGFQRAFTPKVNYSQATVNRHASEAMLLDSAGAIVGEYSRVIWDADEVVSQLEKLVGLTSSE
jgi:protein SCO1